MAGPATLFQTGDHASRPAASAGCVLYTCDDHDKVYRSDGSAWSDFIVLGSVGYAPGGTDVAIADGGTNASTAAGARTNLGLAIGSDVQAFMASASQAEMEAGTEAALRAMSPLRVAQAIAALGGGGGGGGSVAYGSLKPGTPTYDFTGSDLAGATAVSNLGSFGTGNCFEGALDGNHLSLGFQGQSGFLYWPTSNVDQTVTCGGLHATFGDSQTYMMGIAVLNSSNTGVGLVSYNDGNVYLASITGGIYTGILQTISGYGHSAGGQSPSSKAPLNLRINRSTNDWTAQLSTDGKNWTTATSSSSSTITASRVALGLFYSNAEAYKGRLFADYLNVA